MKIELSHNAKKYSANLALPYDISIAYEHHNGVRCFGVDLPEFTPIEVDGFVGDIAEGSPVNFYNVAFNPHGNGTHTECLGHIVLPRYSVNQQLEHFHFMAELISVDVMLQENGDKVIDKTSIEKVFQNENKVKALLIRTFPNSEDKLVQEYTDTNPTYMTKEAMQYVLDCEIEHLLVDIPSVDKEEDDGALSAHKIFWQTETKSPRLHATITELIYVPDEMDDGLYFLNLQIAPMELDASPSKPVLYHVKEI